MADIEMKKPDSLVLPKVEELTEPCDRKNENKDSRHIPKTIGTDYTYKHGILWMYAIGFLVLHFFAAWGIMVVVTGGISVRTIVWGLFIEYFSGIGVTIGAHRLFAHKSFKAKPFLRAVLILAHTIAGQKSMFTWVREHRLHHRYSDTDADPHNSKRGFFFSHIGWLMSKRHPYSIELGRKIDMTDLEADWMIMWQKKYYYVLYFMLVVFIPVWVPVRYFGESWWDALLFCYFTRYIVQLNAAFLVNSAAHLWGTRPYDKALQPVESWVVSSITLGEGWHNYHHVFPWDYKAAESSNKFNHTAKFIEFFEVIGLAYDLKSASPEMVDGRIIRTGDGTHSKLGNDEARAAAVTAIGNLHPLDVTDNVTYEPPSGALKQEGLPLFDEKDVIEVNVTSLRKRRG